MVIEYLLSPNKKFIAIEKELKKVQDSGEWKEGVEIPLRSVCSIQIYDIENEKLLKEINPDYDDFIKMDEWPSNNYFSFISTGFFDVSGIFVYDIVQDSVIDLDYNFDRLSEFE